MTLANWLEQLPKTEEALNELLKKLPPARYKEAAALIFDGADNCWARGISSYCPPGNDANIHLLSHGVRLMRTRNVTVEDCFFAYPQYRGEGGNGYMYTLYGNECLLKNFLHAMLLY